MSGTWNPANLLDGIVAVDDQTPVEEGETICLYGPAQEGGVHPLRAVIAVTFMRELKIPAAAEKLRLEHNVPLWLISAATLESAAELGRDGSAALSWIVGIGIPLAPTTSSPAPVAALLSGTQLPAVFVQPPAEPSRLDLPVTRLEGEPTTFALPNEQEEFGSCLRCHRSLRRRYLFLHQLRHAFTKEPEAVLGFVIYQKNEWLGAGWDDLTHMEKALVNSWGANANARDYPWRLQNLARKMANEKRETLGSFSCWCPSCKVVIETEP